MENYTSSSHIKNHYENGRTEPRVLLESYTEDGSYIEYISTLLSSGIVEYNGHIPDAPNINILVWHGSESIQDPINYVPLEYDSIDTIMNTVDDQVGLEDKVRDWSDKKITQTNYEREKSKFLKATKNKRDPYCTTLLTCTCGEREVFESVSGAIADQYEHTGENHKSTIWLYCGYISEEIREHAWSVFEGARSKRTSIIDRIRGKVDDKDPIDSVPIHYTPLSVALQEVDCYKITKHSTETPPTYQDS